DELLRDGKAEGMVAALLTALVLSKLFPRSAPSIPLDPEEPSRFNWPLRYVLVTIYFFGIIALCGWLQANAVSLTHGLP
ncbi:MAG: hypothetical protein ACE5M4_12070, partial [Anaerolineales bacterium]